MPTNTQKRLKYLLPKLAHALFDEAQKLAPVDRGNLRRSGKRKVGKNSIVISYDVPYAYTLHEGGDEGDMIGGANPSDFPWVSETKGHWRRLSPGTTSADYYNNTTWVEAHTKEYRPHYKPTLLDGGWVTINYRLDSKKAGRKWVQKAWDKVRSRQPKHIRDLLPENLIVTPEYNKARYQI